MPRPTRMPAAAAMATICLFAATAGAHAFSSIQLESHDRIRLAREGRLLELQVLESEQRMRLFQERQQLHRQQERETMRYRPPQLKVPRMRRNCQMQPNGSQFLPNCR